MPKINAPKKKQKVSGCTYKEFENCLCLNKEKADQT